MPFILISILLVHLVQSNLVPPKQLYREFEERFKTFCRKNKDGFTYDFDCVKKHKIQTDYMCRGYVSLAGQDNRFKCYCSGAIYEYIEYGEICTRYSFEANPTTPQYGKDPVIKLPFNWGTNPDRAYTEDGEPYTVRPLNSFLSINATENRISRSSPLITKLKRRGIDVAIKDLAMDFIKSFHVKDSDKNLLFSPLSLHAVLAVLYEGVEAEGSESQDELQNFLGVVSNRNYLQEYYEILLKDLNNNHGQEEVSIKSDIFLSSEHAPLASYLETLADNYRTTFSHFDKQQANYSLEQINRRIAENTQGLVDNTISSLNNIDLFIINSLFINTPWAIPFEKSESKMDFVKNKGSFSKIDSMRVQSSKIKLDSFKLSYEKPGGEFVSAPVLDEDLKRNDLNIITIPIAGYNGEDSNFEFRIYLGKLDKDNRNKNKALQLLIDRVRQGGELSENIFKVDLEAKKESPSKFKKEIVLKMPIFNLRSKFNVKEFLISKGVKSIFTENAKLTRMVNETEGLYVNSISQDVFIDVSEEGAKAAAVSTLGLKLTQGSSKLIINVDSPFIFSMWSKTFDFPLIVGLVNDPLANTNTVTVF